MITNYLVWREIERLASSPSDPEPERVLPKPTRTLATGPQTGSARRKAGARRIGIYHSTESAKNERIQLGLEKIYGIEKTRTVLEQALTIYKVSNPHVENTPELYELFESGYLDQALEYFGQSWVIGRPRLD